MPPAIIQTNWFDIITGVAPYSREDYTDKLLLRLRGVFEDTGEFAPSWEFISPMEDGKATFSLFVATQEFDEHYKQFCVNVMRSFSEEFTPDAYMFVSEAWTVSLGEGKELDCAPADHPEREENALVLVQFKDTNTIGFLAPITTENGVRKLGEWSPMEDGQIGGRFANVINPPLPS